ncbi:MAG: ATP-dependent helicase RhlE [Methanolobus sp.]|jgi:ATP-dependent RNA helicase RhlE|uniref:DNA/RNA helicase, superfamily II n=2 Tax=Methanolobus TaxID=2220 RepID=W9DTM5_METTI|nr:DEAD/DEAH box helicase [Methanolobus tindarius]ETA69133.1 DNA/RNA helicase, superfamily II [Methanolobus tindarius DSM 2278]MDK2831124.1 ATP-dependent helicase RhlE [Methanolobus sp.]
MSFDDLNLIYPLQRALKEEGYTTPTPIQKQSIPHLLGGRDMIGIAQTGTGKTASFILPILHNMSAAHRNTRKKYPRVLVLAPTRELAAQIGDSFSSYGRYTRYKHTVIFGGVGQGPQVKAISKGVDSLVATPGRLLDLVDQGHVNLSEVEYFVLDEADRMLDMGFVNDVYKVVEMLPQKRQSLFFSATMSPDVSKLARKMLTNPVTVEVTPQATTVERIDQFVFFVDSENKNELILQLLRSKHLECVLIFTRTKHRANKVAQMLNKNRIPADAIHGNKSQTHRTKALQDFRSGKLRVLVATDIAARGIDVEDISHVINYDLPNIPESYVHRIGRTARAGADGTAFSFCAADERDFLREIEKLIRMEVEIAEHEYHSEKAKNATGDNAKPAPRQYGRPRGSGSKRGQGRGKNGDNKGGRKSGGNNRNKDKNAGNNASPKKSSPKSSPNGDGNKKPKRNMKAKSIQSHNSRSKNASTRQQSSSQGKNKGGSPASRFGNKT